MKWIWVTLVKMQITKNNLEKLFINFKVETLKNNNIWAPAQQFSRSWLADRNTTAVSASAVLLNS